MSYTRSLAKACFKVSWTLQSSQANFASQLPHRTSCAGTRPSTPWTRDSSRQPAERVLRSCGLLVTLSRQDGSFSTGGEYCSVDYGRDISNWHSRSCEDNSPTGDVQHGTRPTTTRQKQCLARELIECSVGQSLLGTSNLGFPAALTAR